ncbi:MAG: hypothetical protein ACRDIX_07255 [Actinomycetota bacterium]
MIRALRALGRFLEDLVLELLQRAVARLEAAGRSFEVHCRLCDGTEDLEPCGICDEPICDLHGVFDAEAGTACMDHFEEEPARLRSVR